MQMGCYRTHILRRVQDCIKVGTASLRVIDKKTLEQHTHRHHIRRSTQIGIAIFSRGLEKRMLPFQVLSYLHKHFQGRRRSRKRWCAFNSHDLWTARACYNRTCWSTNDIAKSMKRLTTRTSLRSKSTLHPCLLNSWLYSDAFLRRRMRIPIAYRPIKCELRELKTRMKQISTSQR